MPRQSLSHDEVVRLLDEEVFDIRRAATYLGISEGAVEMAAARGRLPYNHVYRKKLFARGDLDDYKAKRARGRASRLTTLPNEVRLVQATPVRPSAAITDGVRRDKGRGGDGCQSGARVVLLGSYSHAEQRAILALLELSEAPVVLPEDPEPGRRRKGNRQPP